MILLSVVRPCRYDVLISSRACNKVLFDGSTMSTYNEKNEHRVQLKAI